MLSMTEAAGEYLSAILDGAQASEGDAVRFVLEGNALAPRIDTPQPGDETYEHEGRKVLVLDEQVAEALGGSTLDVRGTDEGPRLVIVA